MPNLILLADAYKYSHHKLYAPGTEKIYSYLESRGGLFEETVFYGLQYQLKAYFEGQVITKEKIAEAQQFIPGVFGRTDVFDATLFDHILDKHEGRLPVRIKAVPEGSVIPVNNVLMTIENTDPACYWLSNFLETLLMQVWYPSTVATLSREVRKLAQRYFEECATPGTTLDFALNDFGFRGVSSVESAAIGGSAHLLSFSGSDTVAGSILARDYYGAEIPYGLSVPATEHSVCTLLGEAGELQVFRQMLDQFPTGTISCVSDSYDVFRACSDYWGGELKDRILARNGVLVIRPDSGDPLFTLLRVFEILMDKFGYTLNEKGYKVLPAQVRVLQGDGVNYDSIRFIYQALQVNGISPENLLLGMGGGLLQKVDRDTQKFALKCSYACINGRGVDVEKHPVELDGHGNLRPSFKKSKSGRLCLVQTGSGIQTVREDSHPSGPDLLETVFENGRLVREEHFDRIRARARS